MTDVVLWKIEPLSKRELITLRETLRRIGLMKFVRGEGYTLHRMCYCYIVGKRQYLCHAKQFRALKRGNQPIPELDEDEKQYLENIVYLLHKWGLAEVCGTPQFRDSHKVNVVKYHEFRKFNYDGGLS